MIRETSLYAYENLKNTGELSRRELTVYEALERLGECTSINIMSYLGENNPNVVRPRLTSLRDSGFIEECGTREDVILGSDTVRKQILWRIKK